MPNDEKLVTDEMMLAGWRAGRTAGSGALPGFSLRAAYLAMRPLDPEWVRMREALERIEKIPITDIYARPDRPREIVRAALNSEVSHGRE